MTTRVGAVLGAVLVGMLTLAQPAGANNIVVNGGFETGDLTGWIESGNLSFSGVDGFPHSGSFARFSGAIGSENIISQTLPTIAGIYYDFSLWEDGGVGCGTCSFSVYWNGVPVFQNSGFGGYTQVTGNVLALGNDVLGIGLRNDPGFSFVDDVVVDTAVPEPATGVLLLTGLAAIARRRRLAKKT
jgi:hypothetical protein